MTLSDLIIQLYQLRKELGNVEVRNMRTEKQGISMLVVKDDAIISVGIQNDD